MTNELMVSIYRPADGMDCTNKGLSSIHNEAIVFWDVPVGSKGKVSSYRDFPVFYLVKDASGENYKAVPHDYRPGNRYMFGGNFIYTSDSRWPTKAPIKIHDRRE